MKWGAERRGGQLLLTDALAGVKAMPEQQQVANASGQSAHKCTVPQTQQRCRWRQSKAAVQEMVQW